MRPRLSKAEEFFLTIDDDARNEIFSLCQADTLLRLCRVSSTMAGLSRAYIHATWDIQKFLKRWFQSPKRFLHVLHVSGGIVAGSQPLQFFKRTRYPNTSLDIYIRFGAMTAMLLWLEDADFIRSGEGSFKAALDDFLLEMDPSKDDSFHTVQTTETGILAIVVYNKDVLRPDGQIETMTVRVVIVEEDPMFHIVFRSHSSIFLCLS